MRVRSLSFKVLPFFAAAFFSILAGALALVPIAVLIGLSALTAQPAFPAAPLETAAPATNELPPDLKGVGITEHLGSRVNLEDLKFKDEQGLEVPLSKYFGGTKPVLLTLVYYECPNLCTFLLNGLIDGLKPLHWTPGREFEMVTVSIDPKETPALALKKKHAYLAALGTPQATAGWHFLTGSEPMIRKLAGEIGFGYQYVASAKQYAHAAAAFVLTPEGKISRTLYGVQYYPNDLRLALVEASQGKVGSVIDRILLFCYRYDSATKRYSVALENLMKAAGGLTVLVFGIYLGIFWRRQAQTLRS